MPISQNQIASIIAKYGDKRIDSKLLPTLLTDPPLQVEKAWTTTIPNIPLPHSTEAKAELSFTASGAVAVSVFNDNQDRDDDALYGGGNAYLMQPDIEAAWLKYIMTAQVKASANLSIEALGFSFGSDCRTTLALYRKHKGEETLNEVLTSDITSFTTVLDEQIHSKLHVGDVAMMRVQNASVKFTITIDWASLLATILPALQKVISIGGVIDISGLTASTAFAIELQDNLQLAIARLPDNHFAVRLSTQHSSSLGVNAGVSFSVGLASQAQEVIQKTVAKLLSEAAKQVNYVVSEQSALDVLTKLTNGKKLSPAEQDSIVNLAKALGADETLLKQPEKWFQEQCTTLEKEITRLMTETLKVALTYSYTQERKTSTLLEVEFLSADALQKHYRSLLQFNITAIKKSGEENASGISITKWLFERWEKSVEQYGLSLKILGLTAIENYTTTKEWKTVEEFGTQQEPTFTASFFGNGTYNSELNDRSDRRSFTIKLDSQGTSPSAIRTNATLHLSMQYTGATNELKLARIFDQAALWGAITNDQADAQRIEFLRQCPNAAAVENITYTNTLVIGAEALRRLLHTIAQDVNTPQQQEMIAQALAASMPYDNDPAFGDNRSSIVARTFLYREAWLYYLGQKWDGALTRNNLSTIAQNVAQFLQKANADPDLIKVEERCVSSNSNNVQREGFVFAGLMWRYAGVSGSVNKIPRAMKTLQRILDTGSASHRNDVTSMFEDIGQFGKYDFGLRFLGAYLLNSMNQEFSNDWPADVERSLLIEWTEKTTKKKIIVTPSV